MTLLILQLLGEKDRYGYELTEALEQKSDSLFTLKEGTLYPILHGLENEGMIEAYWENTESARKRKYYRITESGKKGLKEKKEEWQFEFYLDKYYKYWNFIEYASSK